MPKEMPQTSNQFSNTQIIPISHKNIWLEQKQPKRHSNSNQVDRFQLRRMNEMKMKAKKKKKMYASVAFLKQREETKSRIYSFVQ